MMIVIGAITPPLGPQLLCHEVAHGRSVELNDIFAGALPFVALMLLITVILCIFPEISLWLPNLMTPKGVK